MIIEFLHTQARTSCYRGLVIDVLRRPETSMTHAAMLGVEARIVRVSRSHDPLNHNQLERVMGWTPPTSAWERR
jgi:hypothetical protein